MVDLDFQRCGIGEALIKNLQDEIKNNRPDIYRVEIIDRESNPAIKELYARMGFKEEGHFEGRIKGVSGKFEADIPIGGLIRIIRSSS